MNSREAKLAIARKKLKDHQEKKKLKVESIEVVNTSQQLNPNPSVLYNNSEVPVIEYQEKINAAKSNEDSLKTIDKELLEANQSSLNEQLNVDLNVTEMLITSKRNLELQISEMQCKLREIDSSLRREIMGHNDSKNEIKSLKTSLHNVTDQYTNAIEQIKQLNKTVEEVTSMKAVLTDANNNLSEQLEFTKTILTAKETENASLYSQINQLQSELEVTKLQLQQLINGSNYTLHNNESQIPSQSELILKVENLEQQIKLVQKDRDQISSHYEHYVAELNEQLRSAVYRNDELSKQVLNLSDRETSLVDQISEMEIRIQNLQVRRIELEGKQFDKDISSLQSANKLLLEQSKEITEKFETLQKTHIACEMKINELQEAAKVKCSHDDISISKLTADIASDKIAAQRATEQNKKLKTSMQELEEAFVKMSQDKLELTEKITAEKFLNRELTIKLADNEEKCKDFHTKLRAKDDEMIRLQASYRDLESEFKKLVNATATIDNIVEPCNDENQNNNQDSSISHECVPIDTETSHNHDCPKSILNSMDNARIPKEDAMVKLQERFIKIVDELADLSDEKHRLEHIILQLQNETDTICEYVALYQQQRSLLKKRDEERSTQIKLFQVECDRLKRQLEELSTILIKFAEDEDLSTYFKVESRQRDMDKVRSLLLNLKNNTLVDPKRNNLELSNVYRCNCCSGKLIDV